MGFFDRIKQRKADLERTAGMVQYLSQFSYLPDISECVGSGDWALYRKKNGETNWYVREDIKPMFVEERATIDSSDQLALVLSYYTDKKGNSDCRFAIARGTNDALESWFNVGTDFGSEYTAISKDGTALFFDDGNEKLHIIDAKGKHRMMQLGGCRDYIGNCHGFFWWDDDEASVMLKGFSYDLGDSLSKKIKAPKDMYYDDSEMTDDGLCVTFCSAEDDEITRKYICSFEGIIKELV